MHFEQRSIERTRDGRRVAARATTNERKLTTDLAYIRTRNQTLKLLPIPKPAFRLKLFLQGSLQSLELLEYRY